VALGAQKRRFAEALIAGATQTAAAAQAGSRQPRVQGSRWANDPEVRQYVRTMRAAAEDEADKKLSRRRQHPGNSPSNPGNTDEVALAIADLAEVLAFETTVLRAKVTDVLGENGELSVERLRALPAGLVRSIKIKSTTDAEGQVYAQHEVRFESALEAAKDLRRHFTGMDKPPDEGARELRRAVAETLRKSPDGRRLLDQLAQQAAPAIDVPAKLVG
jgi:hypothetical protein